MDKTFTWKGRTFDLEKASNWSPEEADAYSMAYDEYELSKKLESPSVEPLHLEGPIPSENSGVKITIDSASVASMVKGGLTVDAAMMIANVLSEYELADAGVAAIVKAMGTLQQIPKVRLRVPDRSEVKDVVESYSGVAIYAYLKSKKASNNERHIPSRAHRTVTQLLAAKIVAESFQTDELGDFYHVKLTDGTMLRFNDLATETDDNLRTISQQFNRVTGRNIEFFSTEIDRAVRLGLLLHPCRVENGKIVPLPSADWNRYARVTYQVLVANYSATVQLHGALETYRAMFVDKMEKARPHPGTVRSPYYHACEALYEARFSDADLAKFQAARDFLNRTYDFKVPDYLHLNPDEFLVEAKSVHIEKSELGTLNPIEVLKDLAQRRQIRGPLAPGHDDLADASSSTHCLGDNRYVVATKIVRPLVEMGGLTLLEKGERIMFCGIDKEGGRELVQLQKYREQISAYDIQPCKTEGFDVNGLDVTRERDLDRAMEKNAIVCFDVAVTGTGENTSVERVSTDCSWSKNFSQFKAMAAGVVKNKPKLVLIKTFLPYLEMTSGPVWPEFAGLFTHYDLSFYKYGKLHTDEYYLGGWLRAKPAVPEEIKNARSFFVKNWRKIGVIVKAGNKINEASLVLGIPRIPIREATRPSRLKGGIAGPPKKGMVPDVPGLSVNFSQEKAYIELKKMLSYTDEFYKAGRMEVPVFGAPATGHLAGQVAFGEGAIEL